MASPYFGFGPLDALAAELRNASVPAAEAEALAADVVSEWRQRWRAREAEVRAPSLDGWFYGAVAAAVVPPLVGAAVVVTTFARAAARRLRPG